MIRGEQHLSTVLVHSDDRLLATLRDRLLAPLRGLTVKQRERMLETLRAWLDTQGSVPDMAGAARRAPADGPLPDAAAGAVAGRRCCTTRGSGSSWSWCCGRRRRAGRSARTRPTRAPLSPAGGRGLDRLRAGLDGLRPACTRSGRAERGCWYPPKPPLSTACATLKGTPPRPRPPPRGARRSAAGMHEKRPGRAQALILARGARPTPPSRAPTNSTDSALCPTDSDQHARHAGRANADADTTQTTAEHGRRDLHGHPANSSGAQPSAPGTHDKRPGRALATDCR